MNMINAVVVVIDCILRLPTKVENSLHQYLYLKHGGQQHYHICEEGK